MWAGSLMNGLEKTRAAARSDGLVSDPGARPRTMQVHLLKSKIHRAQVTGASANYEGSLTVALDLMEKVGLWPYERILCSNLANGQRFENYAIQRR